MKTKILIAGLAICAAGIAALAIPILLLAFPADHDTSVEAAKVRNSLLATVGRSEDFAWTPESVPGTYLQESLQAPTIFAQAAQQLFPQGKQDIQPFDRAITLGEHLASGPSRGGAIMSNTEHTYATIIHEGGGYCADYTQSFNALAMASGLSVREWGIAFGDFGAGHAVNEIYDQAHEKWMMIDSFWSLYVRDKASGVPLSTTEFLAVLRSEGGQDTIEFVPIVEERYGFKSSDEAFDYYRQAKDQFFLWGGNNVWSYDAHPVVAWFGNLSRSLEQLSAMILGVHPKIVILPTDGNQAMIDDLLSRRSDFLIRMAGIFFLSLLFVGFSVALLRERGKKKKPGAGQHSRQQSADPKAHTV